MSEQVKIGSYKIQTKLGYGGMSVVYHAVDERDETDVALKILLPQYYNDDAFLRRFAQEGLNARRLHHQSIVKTYAAGYDDGFHYIAMEFISGTTLEQYIAGRGALSLMETLRILAPIGAGLDYAHELGYVHRDMKLNNIMRSSDGQCFLTDFGVSKHLSTDLSMMTVMGQSIGTPSYMSPEQARGDKVTDGKSDIYSLGVIAYRLLTGHLPFTAQDPFELAHKIIFFDPIDPRQINPALDATVASALKQVLAKDAATRPDTCRLFMDSLSGLTDQKSANRFNLFQSLRQPKPAKQKPAEVLQPKAQPSRPRPTFADDEPIHRIPRQAARYSSGTMPAGDAEKIDPAHVHAQRTSDYSEMTQPGTMRAFGAAPATEPSVGHTNGRQMDAAQVDAIQVGFELTRPVTMNVMPAEPPIQMKSTGTRPNVPKKSAPEEPSRRQPTRPRQKGKTTVLTRGIRDHKRDGIRRDIRREPANSSIVPSTPAFYTETEDYNGRNERHPEYANKIYDLYEPSSPLAANRTGLNQMIDDALTLLYRTFEPMSRIFRRRYNLDPISDRYQNSPRTFDE